MKTEPSHIDADSTAYVDSYMRRQGKPHTAREAIAAAFDSMSPRSQTILRNAQERKAGGTTVRRPRYQDNYLNMSRGR